MEKYIEWLKNLPTPAKLGIVGIGALGVFLYIRNRKKTPTTGTGTGILPVGMPVYPTGGGGGGGGGGGNNPPPPVVPPPNPKPPPVTPPPVVPPTVLPPLITRGPNPPDNWQTTPGISYHPLPPGVTSWEFPTENPSGFAGLYGDSPYVRGFYGGSSQGRTTPGLVMSPRRGDIGVNATNPIPPLQNSVLPIQPAARHDIGLR